jgi:hypothetical protein
MLAPRDDDGDVTAGPFAALSDFARQIATEHPTGPWAVVEGLLESRRTAPSRGSRRPARRRGSTATAE